MALMPGGDLKARIRAHPEGMPPAEARAVAAAVARALDYAHRQGFVHRDVKPENILFGADGAPQLTDFGIARAMSSGTRMTATGMSIGSPHYMSPEQARGKEVDGRSDLYSLGVVLYEMLTGRAPFDAADTLAVAYSHVNDPAPQLPPTLADWQPVMDRLLAKSPQDRYSTAADLAEVLAPGSQPRPSATRVMRPGGGAGAPAPAREPATRLAALQNPQRKRLAAVAGGVLLALVAVGIGSVALQNGDGLERETSSGGGSGPIEPAPVQPEPIPTPPSDPRNPFEVEDREEEPSNDGGADAEVRAPPPPPAPEPVVGGGALLVAETTPPGAEVLVDGELVGETPLERADIRAGVREVTLRHPHYETVRIPDRNFEDGVALRVERVLTRGAGRLTVTATPRDAWIEVDGQRLAERTPVTLEDLPAGTVQLTVGAAEHRPLTVAVDIPRDGLARLEPALEPIPFGSLTLDLEPADATVPPQPPSPLPTAETVPLFTEDFESYRTGSLPEDFVIVFNGRGTGAQRLEAEGGNQHLRTAGQGGWSLAMRQDFDFDPPEAVSVSWRMRVDEDLDNYGYTDPAGARYAHFGGFGVKDADERTASIGINKYASDWKIVAYCPEGEGRRPELQLGAWSNFRMDVDFETGLYSMHKDGEKFCETETGLADLSGGWNSWGQSSGIHFSSGNSGGSVTRFDDIMIRTLAP